MFHQIADAHDTLQFIVLDNRKVTDPRYRHSRKHGIHAIGEATTEEGRRHQLADLKTEYGGAVSCHGVDEVPLREYADRFHPQILHHQGADAMLSQLADRQFDAVRGPYRHNGMAFGAQNVGNDHVASRNLTRCPEAVGTSAGRKQPAAPLSVWAINQLLK
jgi:hypothetical protein